MQIEQAVQSITIFETPQFDPFFILSKIRRKYEMDFPDEKLAEIANQCIHWHERPSEMREKPFELEVNGVSIWDIMRAFYIIFENPNSDFDNPTEIQPRELKESLRTIFNANLLDHFHIDTEYTNEQYKKIRAATLKQYKASTLLFDRESFWLISGYTPDWSWKSNREYWDFYTLCQQSLDNIWNSFKQIHNSSIKQTQLSPELHKNILKAREFWSSKWSEDLEMRFLKVIHDSNALDLNKSLTEWFRQQYEETKDQKHSLKGFIYAPEVMFQALLEESFLLTQIHIRNRVFEVLSLLSKSLWPI